MKQFFTFRQCLFLVLFLCLAKLSSAQLPYIVKYLNVRDNAIPNSLTNVNGILYFTAYDENYAYGEELWRSDGTAAGTYILKDIYPGGSSPGITSITNINGTLFFAAYDGTNGTRLWKSDGTPDGTVMLNLGVSPTGSLIYYVNGTMLFRVSNSANGTEWWKTDGTAAGTSLLKDINPGPFSPFILYPTKVNETLYFRTTFNGAMALWKTDGTTDGTVLVKQFSDSADLTNLTEVNGTLFFTVNDSTYGKELWKSDGSESGTVIVKDIYPGATGSAITLVVSVGNTVYFTATDPTYGRELWKSDGSESGTVLVKDIISGGSDADPQNLVNVNGTIFFVAGDGINGRELWKTNGTEGGTELVKDIYPNVWGEGNITSMVNVNGTLYFWANDGTNGNELWKSDGTASGTVLVKDIYPGNTGFSGLFPTNVGGKLYFLANTKVDNIEYNSELWSLGTCTSANIIVTDRNKGVVYNSQTQNSPATSTCHCDLFNNLIATTNAIGDSPVNGNISSKVWIETANDSYVKRHYEIYPESNPDYSTAKVTLYFTQADFDEYNNSVAANVPKLPADSVDTVGIGNIMIEKRGGTSESETGLPDSYTGSLNSINPDDAEVVWNSPAKRWEVSFATTGFGGFFLKTPVLTDPDDVVVSRTATCSGDTVSLSATCASGTLNWYTGVSGGSSIGTTSPLVVSSASTITYYAACEYGLNSSNRIATDEVVVTTMPTDPTGLGVDKTAICSGTAIELTATCPIGTVKWYTLLSGGSAFSSESIVQQTPYETTNYYVACENGNCKTARVLVGQVAVTTQPTNPTGVSISDIKACSNEYIILNATCDIGTITWYKGESDLISVGIDDSWGEVPGITTTYYVACENGNCKSERLLAGTVTVTEQPVDPTEVSVSETTICSGTSITLSAFCSVGTATWYFVKEEGDLLVGTGASITQNPLANAKYYATCENGICVSDRIFTDQILVRPIPAKPTDLSQWGTTVCSQFSMGLSGSCTNGTLRWYESATAATPVGEGLAVYVHPTRTITYYAACETSYCSSERVAMQEIVYYERPVNPTGIAINKTAICNGDSISLSGSCAIGSIKWIRAFTTEGVEQYDLIPTYTPDITSTYYAYCINGTCISDYLPTETVVVSDQPTNPTNLYQGGTALCIGTGIYLSASCTIGTQTWYDSSTGGTTLGTGEYFIGQPTTTTTYYVSCENGNCKSQRVAMNQIVVYQQPVNPTGISVSKTAICNGETITLSGSCLIGTLRWYKTSMDPDTAFTYSPKMNTVYHAFCANEQCSSESVATDEVVVTQQPANPTNVSVNKTTTCSGDVVSLTATCSLGTITWYNSSTGNTIVGTADAGTDNNLSQNPTANITYYAACVNGICNSNRVATNAIIVKPKPAPPVVSGKNAICNGESVTLSASALTNDPASTFHWSGGLAGVSNTISPTITKDYKVVATYGGCNSDSSAAFTVTVNRVPEQPSIKADNSTICRGNTVVLTGQCTSVSDIFFWSNSTIANGNALSGNYKNTRAITEPGTYKGWCESSAGCKGAERSITITAGTNCGSKNIITVTPEKPVICPNSSVILTAAGCSGNVTWLGGVSTQTGSSITVSPTSSIIYFVQCSTGGSTSVDVTVATSNVIVSTNITTGNEQVKALNTIESAKKIGDPDFSPAPVVSYEAGKSITLKPGFVADSRSVFKAEIKGCN